MAALRDALQVVGQHQRKATYYKFLVSCVHEVCKAVLVGICACR